VVNGLYGLAARNGVLRAIGLGQGTDVQGTILDVLVIILLCIRGS